MHCVCFNIVFCVIFWALICWEMAFFCPAFPKSKHGGSDKDLSDSEVLPPISSPSKSSGALNHSSSFVFTKPTLLCVTHDFEPTVDDEISVRKGDLVTGVYREEDWIFVVLPSGTEGFIPALYTENVAANNTLGRKHEKEQKGRSYSMSYAYANEKKKMPSNTRSSLRKVSNKVFGSLLRNKSKSHQCVLPSYAEADESVLPKSTKVLDCNESKQDMANTSMQNAAETTLNVTQFLNSLSLNESPVKLAPSGSPTCYFRKEPQGRVVVLFAFNARVEDDLTVAQGQILTVLNKDDPDWMWVADKNGAQGFVPSSYVIPMEPDRESVVSSGCGSFEGGEGGGIELIVTKDVEPQARDDLQVMRGDYVYSRQMPEDCPGGWLWVYCPRTKTSGFVPVSSVNSNAMRNL